MKAIILAAGKGTRLKKYTKNLPKGMLEFDGKTIIQRQIEAYKRNGIEDIIVIKGYAADEIQYPGIRYFINKDYETTNMVESLLVAKEEFTEDVIVSYSDILFEDEMLQGMMVAQGDFSVAVDIKWQEYWFMRYGRVDVDTESLKVDQNGNIVSLGIPDAPLKEIDARYIGLLKFSRMGLEKILEIMNSDYNEYQAKPWKQSGKTIRQAYMTDLMQAVVEKGNTVKAKFFEHGWVEFDTNEDYEKACEWLKTGELEQQIELI